MARHPSKEKGLIRELLGIIWVLISLTWETIKLIVRYTPLALVTLAQVKREVIETVEEEYTQYQKSQKEEALNTKISQLRLNKQK